jgi:molecular chaperone DnaK
VIDGQPTVLPAFYGHDEMPTYVAFAPSGERLVGWPAKRQVAANPANTIFTIKRLIGRKYASPATQAELGLLPYRVVQSVAGGLWIEAGGRTYSPIEITAIMLSEVRRAASEYLGCDVRQAIITVPAYFDESEKQATRNAAKIAGLEPWRLVAEPTAAALAAGFARSLEDRSVAVYDLGGGTFDISIVEIGDGMFFAVEAVNGDNRLGGEDFDHILVGHFVDEIKRRDGVDLSANSLALHRIKETAERLKIQLDSARTAEETLPYLSTVGRRPLHASLTLSREELDRLFSGLIERTLAPCREALQASMSRPDALMLVGGMSRMPAIQRRVGEFFGVPVMRHHDPSRVVCQGAAIYADALQTLRANDAAVASRRSTASSSGSFVLVDVVAMSFGIADQANNFAAVIPKGTAIPTRKEVTFPRSGGNLDLDSILRSGTLRIMEGVSTRADENSLLGVMKADFGLVKSEPSPSLTVTFDIDANSRLYVNAKDGLTGKLLEQYIEVIDPFSGLVQAGSQFAVGLGEGDMTQARVQADELLTQVGVIVQAHGSTIQPQILTGIEEAREGLQRAMQSRDPYELSGALVATSRASSVKPPPRKPAGGSDDRPVEIAATVSSRSIFISYARADLVWLSRLRVHLAQLERLGQVEVWHDGKIEAGVPWLDEIQTALSKASAAVLLVSAHFMASSFIYDHELPPILERRRAHGLRVFPVFVGHCYFDRDPGLSHLNAFNDPRLPLSAMSEAQSEEHMARLVHELWACLDPVA